MANAVFNANLTYLTGGEGTISQAFNLSAGYRAVHAGSIALPKGAVNGTLVEIPFGTVAPGTCLCVVVRNDTAHDLGLRVNDAREDIYCIAPGGVFLHWSPLRPGSNPLQRVALSVGPAGGGARDGTIGYVVLGA